MTSEMYTKVDNHVEQAQGRAVWQYKDQEGWDKWLEIHVERTQFLENVYYDLLTKRDLTNATGEQLRLLGLDYDLTQLLNEGEEDFRARIRVEISLLKSSGQVPVLNFNLSRLVTPRAISLKQIFPLKILMWIFVDTFEDFTEEELNRIHTTMDDVKAAGVGLDIGLQLNNNSFIVSDNPAGGDVGEGVATLPDGSNGGAFIKTVAFC
jgi:hypothetical protein